MGPLDAVFAVAHRYSLSSLEDEQLVADGFLGAKDAARGGRAWPLSGSRAGSASR